MRPGGFFSSGGKTNLTRSREEREGKPYHSAFLRDLRGFACVTDFLLEKFQLFAEGGGK
jgi:hypothetical protein